jgi:hypothetical protein
MQLVSYAQDQRGARLPLAPIRRDAPPIPAARWREADDVVGAAIFRAAPAADYVPDRVTIAAAGWMGHDSNA